MSRLRFSAIRRPRACTREIFTVAINVAPGKPIR